MECWVGIGSARHGVSYRRMSEHRQRWNPQVGGGTFMGLGVTLCCKERKDRQNGWIPVNCESRCSGAQGCLINNDNSFMGRGDSSSIPVNNKPSVIGGGI